MSGAAEVGSWVQAGTCAAARGPSIRPSHVYVCRGQRSSAYCSSQVGPIRRDLRVWEPQPGPGRRLPQGRGAVQPAAAGHAIRSRHGDDGGGRGRGRAGCDQVPTRRPTPPSHTVLMISVPTPILCTMTRWMVPRAGKPPSISSPWVRPWRRCLSRPSPWASPRTTSSPRLRPAATSRGTTACDTASGRTRRTSPRCSLLQRRVPDATAVLTSCGCLQ